MRAFLVACLAFIVIGAGGYFAVNAIQEATGAAYTTDGARIDPGWSWRTTGAQACEPRKFWQWFFVDFYDPSGESSLCGISQ